MKWEILAKNKKEKLLNTLLINRGLKNKRQQKDFLNPPHPEEVPLSAVGLQKRNLGKAIARIKRAIKDKEEVVVYGDYDADGICATAILWEALFTLGAKVQPYIPQRFSEGYGLNSKSIKTLKKNSPDLKLIITVDNGIVAHKAVSEINGLGIDVIITDHHVREKKDPPAHGIIHTTKVSGAGIAWFLRRELGVAGGLDLACLGTVADMMPLLDVNRSLVSHGLKVLRGSQRLGIKEILKEAAVEQSEVGVYEINFVLAPRINAMGRLAHGIDSLRLLCTKSRERARKLASLLGETNSRRQKIVDEVLSHAKGEAQADQGLVIVAHESYHEGVIGLAASGLVEKFYRPAIVFAKGEVYSKASARSVPGFDIISAVRELNNLLVNGGGHAMAAGFTIRTEDLETFSQKLKEISAPLITPELFSRRLKIDTDINFSQLNYELLEKLLKFEPTGIGNPRPTFASFEVEVLEVRVVGQNKKHLKLILRQGNHDFEAIAFNFGHLLPKINQESVIDVAFNLEENVWNGKKSLQLKIRDIKL